MTKSIIMKLTFQSALLHTVTDINIIYPFPYFNDPIIRIGEKKSEYMQVLWLIHGGTDDYSCWINNTMLSVFAERYPGLMIVMPTVYDFHSVREDADYYGYVSEELPEFIGKLFAVSKKREDNFIAGLSMGGYFAYRIAMSKPEKYACVGSFSSPLDIEEDMRVRHAGATDYPAPEAVAGNLRRDLFAMVNYNIAHDVAFPRTFQTCGTEDMTYLLNIRMRDFLMKKGIRHTYIEWKGAHTWEFWNASVEKFLAWLPIEREEEKHGQNSDEHERLSDDLA